MSEPRNDVGLRLAPPRGKVWASIVAVLCVLYLLNLTGGWIEIPDALPVVGNLDEVVVTVLLLKCLARLGWIRSPKPK
ncbi:MAG: DUF1232 domain-containing protein [Lentisphaeria bacterium]|nr:DUF1232 domain-containing protein [Lentisphaeria bacterium]